MEVTVQRGAWTVCLLACGFLGCRPQPARESELGGLPRLRESQDPQLRDELARLVAEEATPVLLEASERATSPTASAAAKPDRSRNELLSPSELAALLANLDRIYPTGSFRLGPVEFEKAGRLRAIQRHAGTSSGHCRSRRFPIPRRADVGIAGRSFLSRPGDRHASSGGHLRRGGAARGQTG